MSDMNNNMSTAERLDKANNYIKQLENKVASLESQLKYANMECEKMRVVMKTAQKQVKRSAALSSSSEDLEPAKARAAIFCESAKNFDINSIPSRPKSEPEHAFLLDSIKSSSFFSHTNLHQRSQLISAMQKKSFYPNDEIIQEGTVGTHLYILVQGSCAVSNKEQGHLAVIDRPQSVFGELALLYNCNRTASIRALSEVTVYQLERKYYQGIVQSVGAAQDEEKFNLLKTVPILSDLPEKNLRKICDCLEDDRFEPGDCIIRQGSKGDTFYERIFKIHAILFH